MGRSSSGEPVQTTPNPPSPPTLMPTLGVPGVPVLDVANVSGRPRERLTANFRLRTAGASISGFQAEIVFCFAAHIASRSDGQPDCAFGSDPNFAGFSRVAFSPPESWGKGCSVIRALLMTAETVPIPDGTVAMSCAVEIAADASPGVYPFSLVDLHATTPDGSPVELHGSRGTVRVIAHAPEPAPTHPGATSALINP